MYYISIIMVMKCSLGNYRRFSRLCQLDLHFSNFPLFPLLFREAPNARVKYVAHRASCSCTNFSQRLKFKFMAMAFMIYSKKRACCNSHCNDDTRFFSYLTLIRLSHNDSLGTKKVCHVVRVFP